MQIEEEKVDDMTVEQAVGKVSENAGQQQAECQPPPGISRGATKEQDGNNHQRDAGQSDKETVVV